jgi:hypothetical protein
MDQAVRKELITKQQRETLSEFQSKIDIATIEGEEWVETSPEIISHYVRSGLGKSGYFIFKNIKVCEYGKCEALKSDMSRQVGDIVHGDAHVNQVERTTPVTPFV